MAKQVRAARTRVQGGLLTTAPTERSQLVKHSIPEIASSAAGLDGLSEAFGRFFQATSGAINSVREGVLIAERQRIEQENEAQKRLAQGDALAGREMNPELTDDLDYYNTYRAILADRTGYDAVNDFRKWYMEEFLPANPQGDLVAARDEWVKANLTGAEDPEFEGAVLASFYKSSEQIVSQHTEDVVVRHINSGLRNLEAVISEDAKNGLVTPDRLAWYIQSARTLDPRNPHEAAPRVAAAMGIAIQNNPEKANAILAVLEAPGTGINDKSFAESFPDAYTKLQQDAVNSFTTINSIAELEAVSALEERVNQMHTMSDEELDELAADLVSAQWKMGAKSAVDALITRFQKEMANRTELLVKVAHVAHGIETGQVDVDVTRKHLGDYLKVQYGIEDIYEADPAFIAQIFVKAGLELPEDYRSRLSSSIINTQDPETAVKAYDILAGIEAARGRAAVHKILDSSAQRSYDEIARTMRSTNLPADVAIQRVADRRRTESDRKITWADLTGKSNETEGREYADEIIKKQINATVMGKSGIFGWFKTGANIAPGVMNDIREEVLAAATEFTRSGASIEDAIKEAVVRVSGRLEVIPKRNGSYYIQRDVEMPDAYLDSNGVMVPRVRLGRTVFNPTTGEQVDTLSVYEDDVEKLVGSARALIPDGDPDSIYLDQHESASIHGAYAVYEGGDAVVFRAGEEIDLTEQAGITFPEMWEKVEERPELPSKIVLPDSVEELNDMLEGFLGDTGFGFIEITTARGERGYMLAYRPHYGDQKGKSLAEREAEFTQPGTEQP